MRTPSIASVNYTPDTPPSSDADFRQYVNNELYKIKAALDALSLGHLDKSYIAPAKPRDGDIRYADGTRWNPGNGAGVYVYKSTSWVLLG
jgi:hypothetical protein